MFADCWQLLIAVCVSDGVRLIGDNLAVVAAWHRARISIRALEGATVEHVVSSIVRTAARIRVSPLLSSGNDRREVLA